MIIIVKITIIIILQQLLQCTNDGDNCNNNTGDSHYENTPI